MALAKVSDIYPITYGVKEPSGFGGTPDEVQMRFNRLISLSMHPHTASRDEIRDGMVVGIPSDRGWSHWLAFNEVDASLTGHRLLEVLAGYKAVLDAIGAAIGQPGFGRKDYYARICLRNEQVFEEWLADYAEREGMCVEQARMCVLEERESAARSAGGACGAWHDDTAWKAVPELGELDFDGIHAADPVLHDTEVSYERMRDDFAGRHARVA